MTGKRVFPELPWVVVGIDFGTTLSGIAFAHTFNPEVIHTFSDYPNAAAENPFSKTLTASYYKPRPGAAGGWQLESWGYPARTQYEQDIRAVRKHHASRTSDPTVGKYFTRFKLHASPQLPTVGKYLTRFKLHLASSDLGKSSASPLPEGLTAEQVITDYLREMGGLILKHLQQKYGHHFTKDMIQWCITVPSIWDNSAKTSMINCMIDTGLVNGVDGSPHPLILTLEPEAASFHSLCSEQILHVGDKLLVADIGGGTSDIVVQKVVSTRKSYKVKELTTSSGGLCGSTYMDSRFMEFLERKIGPCLQECLLSNPDIHGQLIRKWEYTKTIFSNNFIRKGESAEINIPNRLANRWKSYDKRMSKPARQSYEKIEIAFEEMQSMFDPVVEKNLELISRQLREAGGAVDAIVLVGGFAESPYLMNSIKRRFARKVGQIISPRNVGSAICQGAVLLALNADAIESRRCRKTYGYCTRLPFVRGVDPIEHLKIIDGVAYCENRFGILVRKGGKVNVDECIGKKCRPEYQGQTRLGFRLLSSDEAEPRYAVGETVKEEGRIVGDALGDMKLDTCQQMEVYIFFGRSSIEVM